MKENETNPGMLSNKGSDPMTFIDNEIKRLNKTDRLFVLADNWQEIPHSKPGQIFPQLELGHPES